MHYRQTQKLPSTKRAATATPHNPQSHINHHNEQPQKTSSIHHRSFRRIVANILPQMPSPPLNTKTDKTSTTRRPIQLHSIHYTSHHLILNIYNTRYTLNKQNVLPTPIHIPSSTQKKSSQAPQLRTPCASNTTLELKDIYLKERGGKDHYHPPTSLSTTRYITTSSSSLLHSPQPRTSTGAPCKAHTSKPHSYEAGIALPHNKNSLSSKVPPPSPVHIPKSKIACAPAKPKHHPFPKRTGSSFLSQTRSLLGSSY